mgnify:CR=1 FL=1
MKRKYLSIIFLVLVCLASILSSGRSVKVMKNIFHSQAPKDEKKQYVVVIDAGHGGRDPGKIGIGNIVEKDINLSIAIRLKSLLEQNDIKVVMTREDDAGLYSNSDSNKKKADLNKRIEIVKSSTPDLVVSIHQNSYPEEYVKGAQTFYYKDSDKAKQLAEVIQDQLKQTIGDGNHRQAKPNGSYYLLKNTDCTMVIVECGYLTNNIEAKLLTTEDYQEKMAWGIHLGIIRFLNEENK